MIGAAIYSLLTANAQVSAMVGNRIYPWPLPQAVTLPAVGYVVSEREGMFCDGGDLIEKKKILVGCYGTTLAEAETLHSRVRAVLDKYRGTAGGGFVSSLMYVGAEQEYDQILEIHYINIEFKAIIET